MLIRQRLTLTVAVILCFLWISSTLATSETRGIRVKLRSKESSGAPVAEEVNLYGSSYALVIGIDNYTQGWPRLSGAVRDAKLVAKELRRKGFEVTLKTNLKSNELEQVFKEFFIIKGDNTQARLFVWFAGHGHTLDGEGFLVPADAPRADKGAQFRLKALSMRRFGEYVRLAQSKHAFAVFDSCFSGTIFTTQRSSPPIAVTRATTLPARQFLSSGDAQQQVSDDGMFRKLFVRAIRGEERADANGDGYLTGSELGLFLTDRMTNLTRSAQTPRYGKLRDPDYDRGDFVFLLASSGAVIDKPATKPSKAYLSVESDISGARVFVDGQRVGTTPLSDVSVSAGEHRVLVKKQGYETYQKRVRFQKGRSMSLYVDLSPEAPKRSRIYVDTQPEDTRIKILNIGPAFYQGIELEAGRYHVEVSAKDYETKKLWVTLTAGEDKTLDIRLKRMAVSRQGKRITNSIGMEFVYIQPGTFMMGSPTNESGRDNDEKQHRVNLTKGFYIQTTEVTQGQWKAVMGKNPSKFKNCGVDCPAETVSWNDVQQFINKLNQREGSGTYRLPTEAEWEYSARAGSDTAFANGGISELKCGYDSNLDVMGWYCGNANKKTHPVAQKQPNAWGLYDMHGNVYEWCQDWFGNYPSGSVTDPTGPSGGSGRVRRGGCWFDRARDCRSASRFRFNPGSRYLGLGFRLLRNF